MQEGTRAHNAQESGVRGSTATKVDTEQDVQDSHAASRRPTPRHAGFKECSQARPSQAIVYIHQPGSLCQSPIESYAGGREGLRGVGGRDDCVAL